MRPRIVEVSPFSLPLRAGQRETEAFAKGFAARAKPESWETGLNELDNALGGGLHPKQLTIIAGYTGNGKSSLADQISLNLSRHVPVLYFTFEMREERTTDRLLSKLAHRSVGWVRENLAAAPEYWPRRLLDAMKTLDKERKLYLVERDNEIPTTLNMFTQQIFTVNPKVVIVDDVTYFDEWVEPAIGRVDAPMRRVMRTLADVAEAYDVNICSIHQLKSNIAGKKPHIGDIAESHHISKVADNVIILHRPNAGEVGFDTVTELHVRKNRNGPICTLHVNWNGETMSYQDMHPDDQARLTCCGKKTH